MLEKLGIFVRNHYKSILVVSALYTGLSVYWMLKLETKMQLSDMLPKDQPESVAYQYVLDNFKGVHAITIAVEGAEKNIKAYIEDVADDIAAIDNVERVIYRNENEFFKKHGLLLLKPDEIDSLKGVLAASSIRDFVAGLNDNFEKEYIAGDDPDRLRKDKREMLYAFNSIEDFLKLLVKDDSKEGEIREISDSFIAGPAFMVSPDRTMGIMSVRTSLDITDIHSIIKLVEDVEGLVKERQKRHAVKAGVSGIVVLQRDEMHAVERDMAVSFMLSLVLIIIIFVAGFKLFRYTIIAVIPLIIGIIWAMGLTYIFIGSLNTFTAMMGAILIGLGIDYAIHMIALFTEERRKGTAVNDAIVLIYTKTVKGIITGAVTTAIGFGMFILSSFPAFRDFGMTLGLGIISILFASVLLLPSLLMLFGNKEMARSDGESYLFTIYKKVVIRRSWIVVSFFILLVVLSAVRFKKIGFTTDLKAIEPEGLESLAINDTMIEKFDFSNDSAIIVSRSLKEAHALKDDAEDLYTVSLVESIAQYVPTEEDQKKRLKKLNKIRNSIPPHVDGMLYIPELQKELFRLKDNLMEISDLAYIGGEHKIVEKCDTLVNSGIINKAAERIVHDQKTLVRVQEVFIGNLKDIVLKKQEYRMVTLGDVPPVIKDTYISKDGSYLTTLYPEGDVWNDAFQPLYLRELDSLKKSITGTVMLSLKVFNTAKTEGKRILILVVIAIFIVLIIDYRSFKFATLAMIPMGLTLVLLIGVMAWFGIPFDFVNIIALPIIIGIGVDDGVHLIHRYVIEKKLFIAVRSTGRGIFLTTVTTMAAFGTLMTSTYKGFASFGLVLVLGIGWAYILTIVLLGSLIRIVENATE